MDYEIQITYFDGKDFIEISSVINSNSIKELLSRDLLAEMPSNCELQSLRIYPIN